jgi:hypothetical protein
MERELSRQILEKYPYTIFNENPSSVIRVVSWDRQTDRQTDRHEEANSRFPQFCEHH